MFEISDEQGNACIVEDRDLAMLIIKDKFNPFINIVELKNKSKGNVIKTMEDFICYFY